MLFWNVAPVIVSALPSSTMAPPRPASLVVLLVELPMKVLPLMAFRPKLLNTAPPFAVFAAPVVVAELALKRSFVSSISPSAKIAPPSASAVVVVTEFKVKVELSTAAVPSSL